MAISVQNVVIPKFLNEASIDATSLQDLTIGELMYQITIPRCQPNDPFTLVISSNDFVPNKQLNQNISAYPVVFNAWLHKKRTRSDKHELNFPVIKKLIFSDLDSSKEVKFPNITAGNVNDDPYYLEYYLSPLTPADEKDPRFLETLAYELNLKPIFRLKNPTPNPHFEFYSFRGQHISVDIKHDPRLKNNGKKELVQLQFSVSNPVRPEKIRFALKYTKPNEGEQEEEEVFEIDPADHSNTEHLFEVSISSKTFLIYLDQTSDYFLNENNKLFLKLLVDDSYYTSASNKLKERILPQKGGGRKRRIKKAVPQEDEQEEIPINPDDDTREDIARLRSPIPEKIPSDHPILVGKTFNLDTFIFAVLIKNNRKTLILKLVNPNAEQNSFMFKIGSIEQEEGIRFHHSGVFKFDLGNQERQFNINNDHKRSLDNGDELYVEVSFPE